MLQCVLVTGSGHRNKDTGKTATYISFIRHKSLHKHSILFYGLFITPSFPAIMIMALILIYECNIHVTRKWFCVAVSRARKLKLNESKREKFCHLLL
jgi:hypothetical protein